MSILWAESNHGSQVNTLFFHSPNIGRNVSIESFSRTFASASPSFDPFASSAHSSVTSVISGSASARAYLVNLIFEAFSWYRNFSFAAYCCERSWSVQGQMESVFNRIQQRHQQKWERGTKAGQ